MRDSNRAVTNPVSPAANGDAVRDGVEAGSGSVTTIAVVGVVVALSFGLLAGVAVVTQSTEALRGAEGRAVAVATLVAEGERSACTREVEPVTQCSVDGDVATVTVELHGTRATATAGPQR